MLPIVADVADGVADISRIGNTHKANNGKGLTDGVADVADKNPN